MLKKRFKEYFNFTKKERNGIIVLLFILVIIIAVNVYLNNKDFGKIVLMSDDFQSRVEKFEKSLTLKQEQQVAKSYDRIKDEVEIQYQLFYFDPNTVSKDEMQQLGFNLRQINTLLNYRKKGGVFNKKEDLLKIYGVGEQLYNKLETYIKIQDFKKDDLKDEVKPVGIKKYEFEKVEINNATVKDLMTLPGIGESYANKIISYRELLGGYYLKNQLLEVYGMDSLRFLKIDSLIFIDTTIISKLNINRVKYKTLLGHPYLNKYQTSSIMKYRELKGQFQSLEQLFEFNLLKKEDYLRIKPYFTIDTLK